MESGGCDINQKSWAHLKSFMIVPFKWVRSRFFGIWKVRIYFYCIIFSDKTCFSAPFLTMHTPNNLNSITYCENIIQSPITTYPIIALHEHEAIVHLLEMYSTNQISFCHIRPRHITCHFLVDNLHFITYSNRIIRHHWEKFTWNYMLQIVNFPRILPRFDSFCEWNSL